MGQYPIDSENTKDMYYWELEGLLASDHHAEGICFSSWPQSRLSAILSKGTLLGTPNREPQEYSRYILGIYLPGSSYSIIFLLYSWGSLFGVPVESLYYREHLSNLSLWAATIAFLEGPSTQVIGY